MLQVCIHDVLRPQIFSNVGFSAKPDLWVLQTILLVECFGKSRAGQKQHDMSHLFHGLLINLIRRSECQSIRPPTLEDATDDLEDDWRTWVDAEQKKRYSSSTCRKCNNLTVLGLPFSASCGIRSMRYCFASLFACRLSNSDRTFPAISRFGKLIQLRPGISYGRSSRLRHSFSLALRCTSIRTPQQFPKISTPSLAHSFYMASCR